MPAVGVVTYTWKRLTASVDRISTRDMAKKGVGRLVDQGI